MTNEQEIFANTMYSKAGRFTSEKYIIFQRKDEIINNKQHKINPPIKKNNEPSSRKENRKEPNLMKKNNQQEIQNSQNKEPFSKLISRKEAIKVRSVKNPPPPIGHYHPKFLEIDVKVHHSNIRYHYKNQNSRKKLESLGNLDSELKFSPNKLMQKEKSLLRHKRIGRKIYQKSTLMKIDFRQFLILSIALDYQDLRI